MDSNIFDFLPSILPSGRIITTETFTYKTFPDGKGGSVDKKEYHLSKAPVNSVKEVSGIVNKKEISLKKNDDWIIEDNERIIFTEGKHPDPDTDFTVTYSAQSVLSRYLESVEEETESIDDEIGVNSTFSKDNNTVVSSKYISTARDEELDEIGKLFGPLGRRAGRDTERYRQYLKGIANVYNGRGTKDSVANVVSTVVSSEDVKVERDEIGFKEYFNDNEYSIKFNTFEDHRTSLLYDIVEIVDPSGVRLRSPIYVASDQYAGYSEGPNPDLDKYDNIDSLNEFNDDFISPFNHESPTRGEYPSSVFVEDGKDFIDSSLSTNVIKPIEFHWAEKVTNQQEEDNDPSWSQFQWAEDDWAGTIDEDVYFTGVKWEQADWNKFPYTDFGIVGADTVGFSEVVDGTVADRTVDSTTVSDPAQVTPNIKLKLPQTGFIWNKSNWSDNLWDSGLVETTAATETNIESSVDNKTTETQTVSDNSTEEIQQSGLMWDKTNWNNDVWSDLIEITKSNDSILVNINQPPVVEDTASIDSLAFEISKFAWADDSNWNSMQWSKV